MVGDTLADMGMGRSANLSTIGVLSGIAQRHELEPSADHLVNLSCLENNQFYSLVETRRRASSDRSRLRSRWKSVVNKVELISYSSPGIQTILTI
jgi:hypothetical protein